MRRFLYMFCLLPCLVHGAQIGWLCRVTLNETRVWLADDGQTPMVQLTGNQYYIIKFLLTNKTTQPTLADLGYREYYQIDGTPRPNTPGLYYIVTSPFESWRVGEQYSDLNEFNKTQNIGPIYQSSLGNPFLTSDGWFSGVNDNFDTSAVTPLQGQSGDKFITYSSGGTPQLSDSASDGNSWEYKDGNWELKSNSGNTSTDRDYMPKLDSIISNQDLERQQLVKLLGSAGNGWVYDCKLTLTELTLLASSLGVDVSSIRSSVSSVDGNLATHLSNVGLGLSRLQDDTQGIMFWVQDNSTRMESSIASAAGDIVNAISLSSNPAKDYTTQLSGIKDVLDNIKDNTTATSSDFANLPQPVITNDDPNDSIPLTGWQDTLTSRSQFVFGQMVSWGSSPSVPLGSLHFDFLSRLLTRMVGSIPSVGSDPHMFDVDFELPYVGHIQKSFSFADWSSIPIFRTAMLWVLYLFFALALARLIFKTFI